MNEFLPSLLLGFGLGEFFLVPRRLEAEEGSTTSRRRGAWLAGRLRLVFLLLASYSGVAIPLGLELAVRAVPGLAMAHLLIAQIPRAWRRPGQSAIAGFVFSQLVHGLFLIAAALVMEALVEKPGDRWIRGEILDGFTLAAVFVGCWAYVVRRGARAVGMVLAEVRPAGGEDEDWTAPPAGRVIGILERVLVVTLVLLQAWAGIGLILAAKSIARFKDLEDRRFSEYYLVGTLSSVLIAVLTGLAGLLALGRLPV